MSFAATELFTGTDRFEVIRCLGVGGMGVVYEAFDKERRARVALKTLRLLEPHMLLRFKQEFRALQGLEHPNLVTLLELHSDGGHWFFTMELVEGVDFLSWVRGAQAALDSSGASTNRFGVPDTLADISPSAVTMPSSPDHLLVKAPGKPASYDEARLRGALIQLVEGLGRLHRAGKIHRDIKPSNILVTHQGRVVILDFGLVAELEDRRSESNVVGTVDYMAPEQAAGRKAAAPADWYSVGVLLYEALTGRTPFTGNSMKVLQDKQLKQPVAPSRLCACPDDLDRLCCELLAIEPERRPPESQILQRLGAQAPAQKLPSTPASQPFVGRARELEELEQSLEETRRGKQTVVLVDGPSGVGKSALVRHFTRRLAAAAPDVVVLSGRYYEREAVPYRALDAIMDAVSSYLMRVPSETAESILPLDTGVLMQLFPSLRGVEAVSRGVFRPSPLDPKELRGRVFAAVRELFIRLARRRPVVLVIDDVQWSDPDSRAVFEEAMRPPDGPALLVIATCRTSVEDQVVTERVLGFLRRIGQVRELVVQRLPPDDARELAARLLGDAGPVKAEALAEEAEGHPLFIDALVRHVLSGGHSTGGVRLDDALAARIDELEAAARHVLELVALAAGPLGHEQALRAAGLELPELTRAISALRVQHLVRQTRSRDNDALEPYHDRVRELTVARLDEPTRRARHEELARSLEASGHGDPEALFSHWRGAGRLDRAVPYGAQAAARASKALAFDRAARLYKEALALMSEGDERRKLQVSWGEALANAGRGPEAAEAYAAAVPGAPRTEALELQRRVAEQLLRSGRVDAGLEAVRAVLAAVELKLPKTPRRALASLLWNRARLRLRGLKFRERASSEVAAALLTRIDICWSVAGVLGMVDTIRGANFQTLHLRLALGAGEPFRVARALALEGAFSATTGGPSSKRTRAVFRKAEELSARIGDPYSIGWARGAAGVAAALEGRWKEGYQKTREGEELFRNNCGNIAWELSSFQFFNIYSLAFTGRMKELCRRVQENLRAAEERGDLYGAAVQRLALANLVWLCADDPVEARKKVGEAMAHWSRESFQVEHFWEMLAQGQTDLYCGDGAAAWQRVSERWSRLAASLLLRVQLTRIEARHLRARAALAAARSDTAQRAALLKSARRDARAIEREKMPWSTPLAALLSAGAAAVEERREEATAELGRAIAGLEAADMSLYAHAARRRLARLSGDELGVAGVDEWMRGESILRPDRMTAMLAPGFAE